MSLVSSSISLFPEAGRIKIFSTRASRYCSSMGFVIKLSSLGSTSRRMHPCQGLVSYAPFCKRGESGSPWEK